MTIAGVEPLQVIKEASAAISDYDVDEVNVELSERRDSGWEIRMILTVSRSRRSST
jgi:hypothetical protein